VVGRPDQWGRELGREPEHYFDVMDVVGFLPPPGKEGFITAADERRRLEERLYSVMRRLSGLDGYRPRLP
jgi:hypothetical protein